MPERSNGVVPNLFPAVLGPSVIKRKRGHYYQSGGLQMLVCSPRLPTCRPKHAEQGMNRSRPPFRNRDAQTGRFVQASVAREKRLPATSPAPGDALGSAGPSEPLAVDVPADQAPKTDDVLHFSGSVNDQLARSYQAVVARRAAAVRENLSFQGTTLLTAAGSPPIVPPSGGDTPGASSPVLYRIVTYDKPTEQMKGNLPIPLSALEQIKGIVDFVPKFDDPRKYPLDEKQIRQIAGLLGFRPDQERFFYYIEPFELFDETALAASTEQRPAAYRFRLRGGRVDVLPEPARTGEPRVRARHL